MCSATHTADILSVAAVLGSAAIFGIIKDLGLSTTHVNPDTGRTVTSTLRYSTASSAFCVLSTVSLLQQRELTTFCFSTDWGYIVAVLPFALALQRLPLSKALSLCMCVYRKLWLTSLRPHADQSIRTASSGA